MSRRLKLIVAYDGAPFSGWQSQANGNGIQDHIESALKRITGETIRVHGAGRTDAGVHALAQCAHVDLASGRLNALQLAAALNAVLPRTIRVMRARFVAQNFHARFSATGKVYRYRIWSGSVQPPFELGRSWHVSAPLDVDLVKTAAGLFTGTHDFRYFSANRGTPPGKTTRTLSSIRVRHVGRLLTMDVDGDGFLYKMVRSLVGAAVQCGSQKISVAQIAATLSGRTNRVNSFVAPAHGLILLRVRYQGC